jgi:hypothetical protein
MRPTAPKSPASARKFGAGANWVHRSVAPCSVYGMRATRATAAATRTRRIRSGFAYLCTFTFGAPLAEWCTCSRPRVAVMPQHNRNARYLRAMDWRRNHELSQLGGAWRCGLRPLVRLIRDFGGSAEKNEGSAYSRHVNTKCLVYTDSLHEAWLKRGRLTRSTEVCRMLTVRTLVMRV